MKDISMLLRLAQVIKILTKMEIILSLVLLWANMLLTMKNRVLDYGAFKMVFLLLVLGTMALLISDIPLAQD
jgi:hypothetical protein